MSDYKSLWIQDFKKISDCKFQFEVSGRMLTTFAIGGPISVFLEPNTKEELSSVLLFLKNHSLDYRVIGAGSNLLLPDQGVGVPVIRLGRNFRYYRRLTEDTFEVGASMPLMVLSREVSKLGLSGLEFAGGIPATFGGAIRMNAGAHLGEVSQTLKSITFLDASGSLQTIEARNLNFSYRRTPLPLDAIIISAVIQLTPGDPDLIFALQQKHLAYRKATQPLTLASAGSIFKNPPKAFAGEIIEKAGLKGSAVGNAIVSDLHANWIVNPSKESYAQEVKSLILLIKEEVKNKFGVTLEEELHIW